MSEPIDVPTIAEVVDDAPYYLPDELIVRGTGRCESRISDRSRQCESDAMIGTNVCEYHGGKGALLNRGATSPNAAINPYLKAKDNSLIKRYESLLNNDQYLSLRNEIAMIEAMIQESLEQTTQSDNDLLWQRAQDQLLNFRIGLRTKDKRKQMEAFQRLEDIVGRGLAFSTNRKTVRELMQEKAKLVAQEQKRLVAMKNIMTTEEALTMIAKIVGLIREHVEDRQTRNKLVIAIQQFMYGKKL